tara:strand:+ start:9324 stop:10700 length:1377 start_codon:yes stop_codon:yes gene_type:complete
MEKLLAIFAIATLIVSCSSEKQATNTEENLREGEVLVVNQEGQAIANARIYINEESFVSIESNAEGILKLPEDTKSIHLVADGYIPTSFLNLAPDQRLFQMRKSMQKIEVKGKTLEYGKLRKDGYVDFGLVLPMTKRSSIFQFDLAQFVSPEMDQIEVVGRKINIPSNVALPEQKESYLFLTIKFNKPDYRSFFFAPGEYSLVALHGKFPLKTMVDEVRSGNDFSGLINHFEYLQFGRRELNVLGPVVGADIQVDEFSMNDKYLIKAPNLMPNGFSYFAALMTEENSKFFSTDVKKIQTSEYLQRQSSVGLPFVLGAIAKEEEVDGKRRVNPAMSLSVMPAVDGIQMTHLPLVEKPRLENNQLRFNSPAPNNTYPLATHVALKKALPDGYGEEVVWDIYVADWVEQVEVPNLASILSQTANTKWEVNFLSSYEDEGILSGPEAYEMAEFLTKNALENQ